MKTKEKPKKTKGKDITNVKREKVGMNRNWGKNK